MANSTEKMTLAQMTDRLYALEKQTESLSAKNADLKQIQKYVDNTFSAKNVNTPDENINVSTSVDDFISQNPLPAISNSSQILGSLTTGVSEVLTDLKTDATKIFNRASKTVTENASLYIDQLKSKIGNIEAGGVFNTSSIPNVNKSILLPSSITFKQNPLSEFQTYSYHFKLSINPNDQTTNSTQVKPYTIIESGVNGNYYIGDVTMVQNVGIDWKNRNTLAEGITMTVSEPNGITFIDTILEVGATLGIDQMTTCPVRLELSFIGYDENGKPKNLGNEFKRVWVLTINSIVTTLTSSGSEYRIIMFPSNEKALADPQNIKQPMILPAETVGTFFVNLADKLTADSFTAAQNANIATAEYIFKVDPVMAEWKVAGGLDPNKPSVFNIDEQTNAVTVSFGSNMTISRIADIIIGSTKEAEKMINPESDDGKINQDTKGAKFPKVVQVLTKTEYLQFRSGTNDYDMRYTYYINQYETNEVTINPEPNKEDSKAREQGLKSTMHKRYDYMFTGKNTEVLDMKLDLNFLWTQAAMYYASTGKNNIIASSKFGSLTEAPITSQDDLRNQNFSKAFASNVTQGTSSEKISNFDLRKNFIQSLDLSKISGDSQKLFDSKLNEITTEFKNSPIETEGLDSFSNLPILNGTNSRLQTGFQTLKENTATVLSAPPKIASFIQRSIDVGIERDIVSKNIEENGNLGRSIFGVLLNHLYSSAKGQDLLNLDIEIRGDPYWLGEDDSSKISRLESGTRLVGSDGIFANYLSKASNFFLTFKTPRPYSEQTGLVNIKETDLFVGYYTVNKVESRFSDGKFTQRLEAVRDLLTIPFQK